MSKLDLSNKMISAFTLYKFVQEIAKPFSSFDSYRNKIIDKNGNFIVSLSDKNKINIPTFELFVIYMKKLLNQIPDPSTKAKLSSTTAALSLFKESLEDYDLDSKYIINGILSYFYENNILDEESLSTIINEMSPVNAMGGNFSNAQVGDAGGLAGPSSPMLFGKVARRKDEFPHSIIDLIKSRKQNRNPLTKLTLMPLKRKAGND
tara:strand:- start:206 stop:823 length:618 start_codon:yes stop_codon:yes gene_type:complete